MKLSVLDLVSVVEGGTARQALDNSAAAAKVAEECGFQRYWVAEHHGMEGLAGAATAVALAHIGQGTSTIRIGAGGIMLPNHNPLVIAEQFGTLDALFPGRVDLGLGRAPGADQRIMRALHKDTNRAAEDFPQDVVELQLQFAGDPRVPLQAYPAKGAKPQMWILGSSLFGAQLAAMMGLPYAFASHFAPDHLDSALKIYRERFQPSEVLDAPYCAAAINVVAADSDEEAQLLASSMDQAFVALRTGNPGKLKPPVPGYRDSLPPQALAMLEHVRQVSTCGTVATVRAGLAAFAERTQVDEVIVAASIFDQAARLKSLRLTAEAARETVHS
ncbi:LLM class flavin-dependent oxidoreductase [Novosphingobium sp. ERN07]|uniref:LLM class flavin-dependent oxidoreductase n=1 Tax=Novosphingobium sp. ERN07 TaxID=2726187 RepID=UPI0014577FDD|nr:LLM class flavin-dependent oxidoreductase [Novosphingobium sp. ERN07]NLR69760.1 LLM class flavin-dependent oxidoreductase [Novosphingobium sp. ERN07]